MRKSQDNLFLNISFNKDMFLPIFKTIVKEIDIEDSFYKKTINSFIKYVLINNNLIEEFINNFKNNNIPTTVIGRQFALNRDTETIIIENYYPKEFEDIAHQIEDAIKEFIPFKKKLAYATGTYVRYCFLKKDIVDNFVEYMKQYKLLVLHKVG
jgi:hypothetical protein